MHRRDDERLVAPWAQHLSARLRDAKRLAEERLRRRRAKADDDAWLEDRELGLEPRVTGADLGVVRLLVDAALARPTLPLEVLHRVRDVHLAAVDAGVVERGVEQLA